MRLSSRIVGGGIIFFSWMSQAVVSQWPVAEFKELRVQAKAARVVIQKTEGSSLRIDITGLRESAWKQEKEGDLLILTGPDFGGGVNDSTLTLGVPASSPSVTLVFEEVQAEIEGLSRFSLSALRGKVNGRQWGEGARIFLQTGEVNCYRPTGGVEMESFGAKILVNDGRGPMKVRLFNGDLQMDRNEGGLFLDAFSSTAKINGHRGSLNLNWGKGDLNVTDFTGRVDGQSQSGQIVLGLKNESHVELQAGTGKVSVRLPPQSGSQINLRTNLGTLSVPEAVRSGREGRFKVARGRLTGGVKGSVVIRSDEAAISVR